MDQISTAPTNTFLPQVSDDADQKRGSSGIIGLSSGNTGLSSNFICGHWVLLNLYMDFGWSTAFWVTYSLLGSLHGTVQPSWQPLWYLLWKLKPSWHPLLSLQSSWHTLWHPTWNLHPLWLPALNMASTRRVINSNLLSFSSKVK